MTRTLEEVRRRIGELRESGMKWVDPVWEREFPGAPSGTLARILIDTEYMPRRNATRRRLGLNDLVLVEVLPGYKIRHERLVKGRSGEVRPPVEVRCPRCAHLFPYKKHVAKK